jgi:leader peptidase (prepilin peptidase)/N-methyltransferase
LRFEPALFVVAAALAGLLIGSFLNVCIYRVPRDLSVVRPRSFCPECGKSIAWYDNIPLFSFALLRGRCRHCGKAIGVRYPLVELGTAALFAVSIARYGWTLNGLKWCLFEAIMTVLFWVDLEERILPDEFTLGGSALGLLFAFVTKVPGNLGALLFPSLWAHGQWLFEALAGAFVLTLPLAAIGLLWGRLSKRDVLGLGDIKLLPCIGLFLGVEMGIQALLLGSLLGVAVGGTYIFIMKKKAREYELPLGTFFCGAAALAPLLFVEN